MAFPDILYACSCNVLCCLSNTALPLSNN
jgi:hypothetical protein